jgi:anti-sigma B factor antagonist
MEIESSQYKHCDLVIPHGRIDSATAPQLAKALDDITNTGRYKIILDLSGVDFMSSAGLRVLISTQKTCKRYNRGEIVLTSVPKRIHDALDLAGFIPLFKFYDNALDAVGAM